MRRNKVTGGNLSRHSCARLCFRLWIMARYLSWHLNLTIINQQKKQFFAIKLIHKAPKVSSMNSPLFWYFQSDPQPRNTPLLLKLSASCWGILLNASEDLNFLNVIFRGNPITGLAFENCYFFHRVQKLSRHYCWSCFLSLKNHRKISLSVDHRLPS